LQALDIWRHHSFQLHLANAKGTVSPSGTGPTEEETQHLPQRVEQQAARHYGVALEMTAKGPVQSNVSGNTQLGHYLAVAESS